MLVHAALNLTGEDWVLGQSILGEWREPDMTIAPDGIPYLYRWHVIPRNKTANVYFHIQVADDPERPLAAGSVDGGLTGDAVKPFVRAAFHRTA